MKLNYDFTSPYQKTARDEIQELISEFVQSGKECAEIVDDKKHYKSTAGLYSSAREIIRRKFRNQVDVSTLENTVYLTKRKETA